MMGIVYYETIFCLCINARCIVLVLFLYQNKPIKICCNRTFRLFYFIEFPE